MLLFSQKSKQNKILMAITLLFHDGISKIAPNFVQFAWDLFWRRRNEDSKWCFLPLQTSFGLWAMKILVSHKNFTEIRINRSNCQLKAEIKEIAYNLLLYSIYIDLIVTRSKGNCQTLANQKKCSVHILMPKSTLT